LDRNGGKVTLPQTDFNGSEYYTIEIPSSNKNAFFYEIGTITGVLNNNGVPQLRDRTTTIDISNIIEIKAPQNS
jgi:hypothetical protein